MPPKGAVAIVLGVGIIVAFSALFFVGNVKRESLLMDKAADVAKFEGKKAAKAEVNAQVDNKVAIEVQNQLDERLLPNTTTTSPSSLPPAAQPVDPVSPSPTTTEPEPFNLTTTTTAEPFNLTTTTTIEVPTTVTIPDPPELP